MADEKTCTLVGRWARTNGMPDAGGADDPCPSWRAAIDALAAEARPILEATEGHTPGPWSSAQTLTQWNRVFPTTDRALTIAEPDTPEDTALIERAPTMRTLLVQLVTLATGGDDV